MAAPDRARHVVASLDTAAYYAADLCQITGGVAAGTAERFDPFHIRGFHLTAHRITGVHPSSAPSKRLAAWSQYWASCNGAIEAVRAYITPADMLLGAGVEMSLIAPRMPTPAFGTSFQRPYLRALVPTDQQTGTARAAYFQPGICEADSFPEQNPGPSLTGFGFDRRDIVNMRDGELHYIPAAMYGQNVTAIAETLGRIMTRLAV